MRIYEKYSRTSGLRRVHLRSVCLLGPVLFFDLINELNSVGHGNYGLPYAVLRVALQTPSRFYEIIPVSRADRRDLRVRADGGELGIHHLPRLGLATGQSLRSLLKIGIPMVLVTYLIGRSHRALYGSAVRTRAASGTGCIGVDQFRIRCMGQGHVDRTRPTRTGDALRQRRRTGTGRDHQQRAHLRVRFEVSSVECPLREARQVSAAWPLAVDGRHGYATDRRGAASGKPTDALNPVYSAKQITLPRIFADAPN